VQSVFIEDFPIRTARFTVDGEQVRGCPMCHVLSCRVCCVLRAATLLVVKPPCLLELARPNQSRARARAAATCR
jgi:hypothetical protein